MNENYYGFYSNESGAYCGGFGYFETWEDAFDALSDEEKMDDSVYLGEANWATF